jgi:para-aminobenzoate synthetase component 1
MNSEKDRAENLMIVDLLRNDLGRTCVTGSVSVPKLFALESYPNVHHLVSTVSGRVNQRHDPVRVFHESFPGGSITGAPKVRSMEIIDELEPHQRSAYCGAFVYFSCNGQMDSNITIRTLVADGENIHCWAGGGIVADSIGLEEYQETFTKVGKLTHTLEDSFLR